RDRRAVRFEVDAQDEARARRRCERTRVRHPGWRQAVLHAGRWIDSRDRPPRPVRAVAADPHNRGLPRRKITDQLREQGIGPVRPGALVRRDAAVLERDSDETRRDRPTRRRRSYPHHYGARPLTAPPSGCRRVSARAALSSANATWSGARRTRA